MSVKAYVYVFQLFVESADQVAVPAVQTPGTQVAAVHVAGVHVACVSHVAGVQVASAVSHSDWLVYKVTLHVPALAQSLSVSPKPDMLQISSASQLAWLVSG